jgi:hypothetical protein
MISLVYDVKKYREFLGKIVKKGDVVIELGPHKGKGTLEYAEKVKLGILVDKSLQTKESLEELLENYKNLKFVQGDLRSFETIKKVLLLTKKCDVLALDMGGGRYPDTVFKVWAVWSGIFKPKDSLIRNRGLGEFVQKVKIKDPKIKKKFKDSGWLAEWGRAVPYELKKQMGEFEFWVRL